MKKYTVSLHFQCNEDWTQMTPAEQGRHCKACNKVVIDFSSMSDEAMIAYLQQHKNTCGRFNPKQLNRPIYLFGIKKKSNWPAIAAMLIAGYVSLAPGNASAMQKDFTSPNYTITQSPITHPVEPGKTPPNYTIRLLDEVNHKKILNGMVYIQQIGAFNANTIGEIIIEKPLIENALQVTISAPGYEPKVYQIQLRDLEKTNQIEIYLKALPEDYQMPAGGVSIQEN